MVIFNGKQRQTRAWQCVKERTLPRLAESNRRCNRLEKRAFQILRKTKEQLGTPAQMYILSFSDQMVFLRFFEKGNASEYQKQLESCNLNVDHREHPPLGRISQVDHLREHLIG